MTPMQAWETLAQIAAVQPLLIAKAKETENGHKLDRLLSADEAAQILGYKSVKSLYRAASRYPFAVREGRQLRFSERGLQKYLERRGG